MKKYLPDAATVILVTLMVFAAEQFGNKEIIFPEITALAVGYLVAEKRSWMVNGRRMLGLITFCAVMGVLIVRYMGLDAYPEIVIAFTFAQVLFMFAGTTFAPFVSAIVLPVMLRTTSWVYPVAAFLLTLAIILLHKLFIKMGLRSDEPYTPVNLNSIDDVKDTCLRVVTVAIVGFAAFRLNAKFWVAPPLLVAFTEFSRPRNKTRNKPVKAVVLLTICAIIGTAMRFTFTMQLGIPLTISALLATIVMLFVIHKSKMYMPPAGAICILSMLIPEETVVLFPLEILIGSAIFMEASRHLFMKRQDNKIKEELIAQ